MKNPEVFLGNSASDIRERLRELNHQRNPTNEDDEKKRKPVAVKKKPDAKYSWVKFFLNIWIMKQTFALVGFIFPGSIMLWKVFFPTDYTVSYTDNLSKFSWMELVKSDFGPLIDIRDKAVPVLIHSVPVLSTLVVSNALLNTPIFPSSTVKISNKKIFQHYSTDRLWSNHPRLVSNPDVSYTTMIKYLNLRRDNCTDFTSHSTLDFYMASTRSKDISEDSSLSDQPTCSSESSYMYSTCPGILPYISKLAPSLNYLFASQNSQPQVSLWIASPAAQAALHYDMEDNFLLQLSGSKTVLLLSQEGYPLVQPFSSLHPYWRHAQHSNLSDTQALLTVIQQSFPLQQLSSASAPVAYRKPDSV